MARIALVTGGTRCIGAAISEALPEAGHCVVATYAGNDAAAKAFRAKTGAAVYRWDASDFEARATGIRQVGAAVGPIDVLVNNAGIVRDLDFAAHGVDSKQIREKRDALFAIVQSVLA
jgi:acetoacetyl-CoA reductase